MVLALTGAGFYFGMSLQLHFSGSPPSPYGIPRVS